MTEDKPPPFEEDEELQLSLTSRGTSLLLRKHAMTKLPPTLRHLFVVVGVLYAGDDGSPREQRHPRWAVCYLVVVRVLLLTSNAFMVVCALFLLTNAACDRDLHSPNSCVCVVCRRVMTACVGIGSLAAYAFMVNTARCPKLVSSSAATHASTAAVCSWPLVQLMRTHCREMSAKIELYSRRCLLF